MPYVLKFNESAIQPKMRRLAHFLERAAPSFDSVLTWVLDLRRQLAIPHTLGELGVPLDGADSVATKAEADGCAQTNPVPVHRVEMLEILRAAHAGNL
jgi:alcohol dehydrogenase class IV